LVSVGRWFHNNATADRRRAAWRFGGNGDGNGTQNVVTYKVVVETDNSTWKLLPYLTANLKIEVGQRRNILLVPNADLRWQPQPQQIAPNSPQLSAQTTVDGKMGTAAKQKQPHEWGVVWVS
jgi:hypothetical protein